MAAYNYFPASYQPYYGGMYQPQPQIPQIPTPQAQPQQAQQSSGVNWVQGEAGARSWLTAPNTTVLLMDSEAEKFYLKSTDASGIPQPLRVFEYHETTQNGQKGGLQQHKEDSPVYVTKSEFEAFRTELDGILSKKPTVISKRKEEKDDE